MSSIACRGDPIGCPNRPGNSGDSIPAFYRNVTTLQRLAASTWVARQVADLTYLCDGRS